HGEDAGGLRAAIAHRRPGSGVLWREIGGRRRREERLGVGGARRPRGRAAGCGRGGLFELRERALYQAVPRPEGIPEIAILREEIFEEMARLLRPPEALPEGLRLRALVERALHTERHPRGKGEGARVEAVAAAGHASLEPDAAAAIGRAREGGPDGTG